MMPKDECLKMEEFKRQKEADHIELMIRQKEKDLNRSEPKRRKNTSFTPKEKKRKK